MKQIDPETGEPYTQEAVARELQSRGVPIQARTYSNIEGGVIQRPKPDVINALPEILPQLSIVQLIRAMGYDVRFEGIRDEAEAVLLEAFQLASEETQRVVRLALGLEVPQPTTRLGTSLRRLAATDRPGRRGSQE